MIYPHFRRFYDRMLRRDPSALRAARRWRERAAYDPAARRAWQRLREAHAEYARRPWGQRPYVAPPAYRGGDAGLAQKIQYWASQIVEEINAQDPTGQANLATVQAAAQTGNPAATAIFNIVMADPNVQAALAAPAVSSGARPAAPRFGPRPVAPAFHHATAPGRPGWGGGSWGGRGWGNLPVYGYGGVPVYGDVPIYSPPIDMSLQLPADDGGDDGDGDESSGWINRRWGRFGRGRFGSDGRHQRRRWWHADWPHHVLNDLPPPAPPRMQLPPPPPSASGRGGGGHGGGGGGGWGGGGNRGMRALMREERYVDRLADQQAAQAQDGGGGGDDSSGAWRPRRPEFHGGGGGYGAWGGQQQPWQRRHHHEEWLRRQRLLRQQQMMQGGAPPSPDAGAPDAMDTSGGHGGGGHGGGGHHGGGWGGGWHGGWRRRGWGGAYGGYGWWGGAWPGLYAPVYDLEDEPFEPYLWNAYQNLLGDSTSGFDLGSALNDAAAAAGPEAQAAASYVGALAGQAASLAGLNVAQGAAPSEAVTSPDIVSRANIAATTVAQHPAIQHLAEHAKKQVLLAAHAGAAKAPPPGWTMPPLAAQTALKLLGIYQGPLDGLVGPLTETAVKTFQKAHSLQVDGIVGHDTQTALQAASKQSLQAQVAPFTDPRVQPVYDPRSLQAQLAAFGDPRVRPVPIETPLQRQLRRAFGQPSFYRTPFNGRTYVQPPAMTSGGFPWLPAALLGGAAYGTYKLGLPAYTRWWNARHMATSGADDVPIDVIQQAYATYLAQHPEQAEQVHAAERASLAERYAKQKQPTSGAWPALLGGAALGAAAYAALDARRHGGWPHVKETILGQRPLDLSSFSKFRKSIVSGAAPSDVYSSWGPAAITSAQPSWIFVRFTPTDNSASITEAIQSTWPVQVQAVQPRGRGFYHVRIAYHGPGPGWSPPSAPITTPYGVVEWRAQMDVSGGWAGIPWLGGAALGALGASALWNRRMQEWRAWKKTQALHAPVLTVPSTSSGAFPVRMRAGIDTDSQKVASLHPRVVRDLKESLRRAAL